MTDAEKEQLVEWAKRAVGALSQSQVFIGILDDRTDMTAARAMFTMQVGHCVLTNKPIIIPVPYGVEMPPKLAAVADRIVRYHLDDPKSLYNALAPVLVEMGLKPV